MKQTRSEHDSDGDGMPDQWELIKGLDPHNPEDRNKYKESYTFLEIYLNGLLDNNH